MRMRVAHRAPSHEIGILRTYTIDRFYDSRIRKVRRQGLICLQDSAIGDGHARSLQDFAGPMFVGCHADEFRRRRNQPPASSHNSPGRLQQDAVEFRRDENRGIGRRRQAARAPRRARIDLIPPQHRWPQRQLHDRGSRSTTTWQSCIRCKSATSAPIIAEPSRTRDAGNGPGSSTNPPPVAHS